MKELREWLVANKVLSLPNKGADEPLSRKTHRKQQLVEHVAKLLCNNRELSLPHKPTVRQAKPAAPTEFAYARAASRRLALTDEEEAIHKSVMRHPLKTDPATPYHTEVNFRLTYEHLQTLRPGVYVGDEIVNMMLRLIMVTHLCVRRTCSLFVLFFAVLAGCLLHWSRVCLAVLASTASCLPPA